MWSQARADKCAFQRPVRVLYLFSLCLPTDQKLNKRFFLLDQALGEHYYWVSPLWRLVYFYIYKCINIYRRSVCRPFGSSKFSQPWNGKPYSTGASQVSSVSGNCRFRNVVTSFFVTTPTDRPKHVRKRYVRTLARADSDRPADRK